MAKLTVGSPEPPHNIVGDFGPGDNESTDRSAYALSVETCAGFTDTRQGNTAYEVIGTAYWCLAMERCGGRWFTVTNLSAAGKKSASGRRNEDLPPSEFAYQLRSSRWLRI